MANYPDGILPSRAIDECEDLARFIESTGGCELADDAKLALWSARVIRHLPHAYEVRFAFCSSLPKEEFWALDDGAIAFGRPDMREFIGHPGRASVIVLTELGWSNLIHAVWWEQIDAEYRESILIAVHRDRERRIAEAG